MKRARDEESPLVVDTREWVKEQLAGMDGSHDFAHIERVWKLARQIGLASSPEIDMQVVELAALLHDIDDWKYSGSETAGIEKASAYLRSQKAPEALVLKVSSPPCCIALSLPSHSPTSRSLFPLFPFLCRWRRPSRAWASRTSWTV